MCKVERNRAGKRVLLQAHRQSFTHSVCHRVISKQRKHLLLQRNPNQKPQLVHLFSCPTAHPKKLNGLRHNVINWQTLQTVCPKDIILPRLFLHHNLFSNYPNNCPNMPPPAAPNISRQISKGNLSPIHHPNGPLTTIIARGPSEDPNCG